MKRKSIGILTSIMIISTLAVTILSTVSFSAQQVSFSIIPDPKIDIVLAKSRTTTNVTNFERDIINQLRTKGVNTSNVKVSSVEAQQVNMQNSFSWSTDVSSSIGSISITNNGQNVEMIGNRRNPGKNAIWIIPEEGQEQEFNFGYNIDYGDSFNAAGMLLRVQRTGNVLQGYMLSFNNSPWVSSAGGNNGALWKFTYNIGSNSSNMTKTLVQGLNINKSGTLNVKVTDNQIAISGGGLSGTSIYTFTEAYGNGFGFFSDHYSHNCSRIGSFTLTNINLQTTIVKKFSEVLRQPEWRDGAIKVLVSVEDYQNKELTENSTLGELLTRLLNENISFVSWGASANQSQYQSLIHANNDNGIFINNTNYTNSVNQTASYIKTLIDKIDQKSNYLILGDSVSINVSPPELANNTADSNYPYGKWKINHDFLYYENHVGQFSNSGKYINNFITNFDKTGKYTITFADSTVVPGEVYVHRRPTALIRSTKSGNSISLQSNSYDLDSYTTGNKGITQEEWKYKRTTDSNWTSGKLASLTNDTDYVVQLRVKDYQGVWSYPVSIYATSRTDAKPIASFGIKNSEMTKYEQLELIDTSYDPYGGTISSRTWEVYQGSNRIYTGANPPTTYNTVGDYTMKLTVTNNRGLNSESYSRKFKIIEDNIAPEVVVTPTESDWTESANVHLEFTDQGGSNFKQYQYAITNSQSTPTTWSGAITKASDNITINQEGLKYLHIKATDNAGNTSEVRVTGPYRIDRGNPKINYTGDLTSTKMDYVDIKLEATDEWSGIQSFTVNGQNISNGTYRFSKNGTYQLVARDKIGHTTTVNLEVRNVYYYCIAGLDHPIYSSNYDGCPICASYAGLRITEDNHIYHAGEQGVKYENPKNAPIVEYYNGSTTKPKDATTYSYELKVVYEGSEYQTGIKGNYTIAKRILTIDNIIAIDRVYQRNNYEIQLQGGELRNLVYQNPDHIGFTLNGAYVENNQAGKRTVKIRTVELTNNNKNNYQLVQPNDVTVNIIQDKLTITNIKAQDRQYDGTNEVLLSKGKLLGIQDGDEVSFVLPNKGTISSKNIGDYPVSVPEITLTGKEANNYYLVQPKLEEVNVKIMPRILTIDELLAVNRIYDKKDYSIEVTGGRLHNLLKDNIDNIGFTLHGGYVEKNDVGTQTVKINEIQLTNNEIGNYQLEPPADIKVEIGRKELNITDISAQDKIYNSNTLVVLNGGRLIGVCEGDEVRFVLPYQGNLESKNVGTWKVAIDEITLEGKDAYNYTLKQPNLEDVSASVTKRLLAITNLKGKNRIYNGEKEVDIIGGEIVGLMENDDVIISIPKKGISESENVGTWNVTIEDITIEGQDVPNYRLIQPEKGDIQVVISKEEGKLIIGCDDKLYDRKVVEPYIIEKNSTSEVEYHFYKTGTEEEIEKPYDIGTYDVIAYMPTDGNYTEVKSNKIIFEIKKPLEPLLQITTQITKINDEEITSVLREKQEVQYRDTIHFKMTIHNLGEGSGYAQKIITKLPEGIILAKDNEINNANGWTEKEKGIIETEKLSLETKIENEIFPVEKENAKEETPQVHEQIMELVLQVTDSTKLAKDFLLETQLIQQDKHGDMIEYTEENKHYGNSKNEMELKYVDLQIEKRITEILEKDIKTGVQRKYDIYQKQGHIVKLELSPKKIGNTELIIVYEIRITNLGNKPGVVENIVDILPKGVSFELQDNPGWKIDQSGNVMYEALMEKILPNETKTIELKIRWKATEDNLVAKTNYAAFQSHTDLDEILANEKKIEITKTNNYAHSEMLLSVITGRTIVIWVIIMILVAGILTTGIVLIKKYVLKQKK